MTLAALEAQARAQVGRRGLLTVHSRHQESTLAVPVEIRDARVAFGRVQVLVIPLEGSGRWWVNPEKVLPMEEQP